MGIRFACHVCAKQLNIKEELAGKRGICPACSSKFRIPGQDAERSLPIEDATRRAAPSSVQSHSDQADNAKPEESLVTENPTVVEDASMDPSEAKPEIEIDLLSSDPDATWYVRPPSGGQYGPADGDVLRAWIAEGRVAATALLWRDGWPNWRTAKDVLPGLSSDSPSPASGATASAARATAAPAAPAPPQSIGQPAANSVSAAFDPERPVAAEQVGSTPVVSGRSDVGTARRQKNSKRILLVGALALIAVALVAVLAYLIYLNG